MAPNYSSQEGEPYEGDARGVPKPPAPGAPEAGEPTPPNEGQPAEPTPTFPFDLPAPPAGMEWDPLALKDYQAAVQDLGVTPEEARAVLQQYAAWTPPKDETEYRIAQETAVTTLKKEWGADFDSKLEAAVRAASRLPATLLAELDRTGLGNDPGLIRRFAALGETMGSAQDTLNKILGDKSSPYWHQSDPRHEATMKEVRKLYERIHGSRPISGGGVR